MKIAILIPDRGDRPAFMANCLRMLKAQTLQADHIEIVDDKPLSEACDITWRYRIGYDRLRKKGFDLIALCENDDWYDKDYLKIMVQKWQEHGHPNIFGTNYTIYYHINLFKHMTMNHHTRSSAMNTLIKPDLNFEWCLDAEPYTDMHLWLVVKGGVTFKPERIISIGIKHGVGLCGGKSHTTSLQRYVNDDSRHRLLLSCMDSESYSFYTNYFKKEKQ